MKKRFVQLTGVLLLSAWAANAVAAGSIRFEPYIFEARSGEKVEAEKGVFEVPENRSKPGSRTLKLAFVRFASTNPDKGPPIIYLAGGPGGSGVDAARGRRFPLFMALREVADVIALDQRGTGWSNDIPPCDVPTGPDDGKPLTRDQIVEQTRKAMAECARFFREKGVDLAGYNTNESADDIEELRRLLGVPKVSLWGISYGTHLALATLKRHGSSIDRAVLASIEGLDETVKLPALTDAFFGRLQKVIEADPVASKIYPDFVGTMRRVHAGVEKEPATAVIKDAAGQERKVSFSLFELQLLLSASIADPSRSSMLPALCAMMDRGDFTQPAALIHRMLRAQPMVRISGMAEAMDAASGISPSRARLVERQAKSALVGDALNYPMPHMADSLGVPDLGESFRSPVTSDVPTLFLSGTLDGRTYPESAAEIASRFARATRVIVENGGHNIFEQDPAVAGAVVAFMKGEPVASTILLPPPQFPH